MPLNFSNKIRSAIVNGELGVPANRMAFVRECVAYFEIQLPRPSNDEYTAIAKRICDEYPTMRSANQTKYWVYIMLLV